jgi:hypothetical protein
VVRVRVAPGEVEPAIGLLGQLTPDHAVTRIDGEEGWLSVRVEPGRAAEVNRVLATAGIYASRLETGSDLESLFLSLTGGSQEAGSEGTFFGLAGATIARKPPAEIGPGEWHDGGGPA